MDQEQRIKAYVKLVEQLLASPREANRILDQSLDLVDEWFMVVCGLMAAHLQKSGEQEKALFLRNLTEQVAEYLKQQASRGGNEPRQSQYTAIEEEYRQFFTSLLQVELESNSDPRVVYPFLEKHQDQLDLTFAEYISQWFDPKISRTHSKDSQTLGLLMKNLAMDICQIPFGIRSNKIEIAIALCQGALQCIKQHEMPKEWADIQGLLGLSYNDRIQGNRRDNLEKAIVCNTAALQFFTATNYPNEWAGIQNNLGIVYRNRIAGDVGENIEKAIACYNAALVVYKRQQFPREWAGVHMHLGVAYCNRIRGERAEDLERAIAYYQKALEVYQPETFPEPCAMTQQNLGNAYLFRIKGERGENIEKAIACYNAALQLHQNQRSLSDWADTKICLGLAYSHRMIGEKKQNLEKAIAYYKEALKFYTYDAYPQKWAMTQNDLGIAYFDRILGEKADNLEQTIACYQAALQVYTRTDFPEDWANTQNNLGNVYRNRIKGDRAENRKQAIRSYKAALLVYTPSSFPQDCLRTGQSLGDLGFAQQNWKIAIEGYHQAILAIEQSRYWATSEATKRELITNSLDIYQRMVQACINHQDYAQALLTVERSKSRTLLELLDSAHLYPKNATDAQKQRISDLRRQIASYQQQLAYTSSDTLTPATEKHPNQPSPETLIRQQLQAANQQFQDLLTELDDPNFTLTQQVPAQLPDLRRLLPPQTALIEWYLPTEAESGFYAFLVTHQNEQIQITPHHFSAEDREHLDQALLDYRSDYGQPTWNQQLPQRLETLSAALQLPRLLAELSQIQHLILIPHRELHLIPLHALPVSLPSPSGSEEKPLQDWFPVQYAPSCQILNNLQQRPPLNRETVPFFAIQNPTDNLPFAEWGVELLLRQFSPHQVLRRDQATRANLTQPHSQTFLEQSHAVHFGCHGEFDEANPLNAYLRLANGEKLTFLEIFNGLNIPLCRLLVLSACKTGLVETSPTDDYVGLSSAFFYAGARTVVASLWEVEELAATLVTLRLYQILPDYPSVTVALQAAQTWLRGLSSADVLDWLKHEQKATEEEVEEVEDRLSLFDDDPPFANAYYWSAFTAAGL